MPENPTMTELFGEVISAYSRAQAIDDGVLVDVTTTAAEAGIRWPVALTRAVFEDCVAWTAADEERKPEFTGQDEAGRLWDVVFMAAMAMRAAKARGEAAADRLAYSLLRVPREGRGLRPRTVMLRLVVGSGDTPAPVVTIMQLGED